MIFNIIKVIHIFSVISWMAGLLYLPRLFVYHSDPKISKETSLTFEQMERKLYKIICNTAAVFSWISGLLLVLYIGLQSWILIKIVFVIGLTIYHLLCGKWLKNFSSLKNTHSQKFFRFVNEVPSLLLVLIVILVVFKPFQ